MTTNAFIQLTVHVFLPQNHKARTSFEGKFGNCLYMQKYMLFSSDLSLQIKRFFVSLCSFLYKSLEALMVRSDFVITKVHMCCLLQIKAKFQ